MFDPRVPDRTRADHRLTNTLRPTEPRCINLRRGFFLLKLAVDIRRLWVSNSDINNEGITEMTNEIATAAIITKLNEFFVDMDAAVLVKTQAWAQARVAAIKEFKASAEYQEMRYNQHALYHRLFAIAGGKSWYNVFNGTNAEFVERFMRENHEATIEQRNIAITKKLIKAGVFEVISDEFSRTSDGFHGTFVVGTDAGVKRITIKTIEAGGWNIQCWHLRTLVKIHA